MVPTASGINAPSRSMSSTEEEEIVAPLPSMVDRSSSYLSVTGDAKSVSTISRDSPPPSLTETDLLGTNYYTNATSSNSISGGGGGNTTITSSYAHPPAAAAGAGIMFGGAKKGAVKKRTRTAKIGAAAQPVPPPHPYPPTPPALPAHEPATTTRHAALAAARKADEFLHEKSKETMMTAAAAVERPPSSVTAIRSVPSEEDDIIAAAKAAAAEAHKLEAQKSAARTHLHHGGVGGGFGSLFRTRGRSPPTTVANSSRSPAVSMSTSSTSLGSTEPDATFLQKEQEHVKRAMAERQLQMILQQQQQQQTKHSTASDDSEESDPDQPPYYGGISQPTAIAPVSRSKFPASPMRSLMVPQQQQQPKLAVDVMSAPRPKTASDNFHDMLDDFRRQVVTSMNEVTRLRQHRAGLLEERFVTNAKERLAVQQKKQALQYQAAAAASEDFERADLMSATIDRHEREEAEYGAILENIGRAIRELDRQKKAYVDAVTLCFQSMQTKLSAFQKEQESSDTKSAVEALNKYSILSKQLSAEHERLQNDWKHLERDAELVAEERHELEKAISEQSGTYEKLRDLARSKLADVDEEIEELRQQLQAKQAVAASLRTEAAGHDESVLKVRVKFARQLNRVQKKEMTIKDNQDEWESEKKSYETQKQQHERQVQDHSEAMLARDSLLDALAREVEMADTFASIVAKEIGFEVNAGLDEPECDDELAQMQANVVKCEAAVTESRAALKTVETLLNNLVAEVQMLERRIPQLEETKTQAAERRDFKAAGKASKEIKEAMSRLAECHEELKSDAAGRKELAEKELCQLELDLEEARKIANEKERVTGLATMARLADNVKRLVATKERVCGNAVERSVPGVGAFVLDAQIKVLLMEGQTYGDKYGGWTELMAGIYGEDNNDKPAAAALASSSTEEGEPVANVGCKSVDGAKSAQDTVVEESVDDGKISIEERMSMFRHVTQRLKESEEQLEAAVADEDFEKAAELDDVLQQLLAEVQALNMTDEEMELAMVSSDDPAVVTPAEAAPALDGAVAEDNLEEENDDSHAEDAAVPGTDDDASETDEATGNDSKSPDEEKVVSPSLTENGETGDRGSSDIVVDGDDREEKPADDIDKALHEETERNGHEKDEAMDDEKVGNGRANQDVGVTINGDAVHH